jgi:hypothetical protein
MKNLLIGLFLIGLTTQGFSQKKGEAENVKLQDVLVTQTKTDLPTININYSYLDEVQDKTTADAVMALESVASRYNVVDLPGFVGSQDSFKTIFRGSKGYIIATYNSEGKILTTIERYRDIKIPKKMVKSILLEFPDSHFLKVVHTLSYSQGKDVKKVYRVRILNDNETKNLRFTSRGDNDNSYTMTLEN